MAGIRSKLEAKPARLAGRRVELEEAERALEELREQVKALQVIVDRKSVQLRAAEEIVEKLSGQLNTLKSNEEYQTMQRQIEAKQAEIAEIEEGVLESMEVVDQARVDLPGRETRVNEEKARLDAERKKLEEEMSDLEAKLTSLDSDWTQRSSDLDSGALDQYRQARDRLGHTALVMVSPEGICGGCHTRVTKNILNGALAGHIVSCNNCGRLLYSAEAI